MTLTNKAIRFSTLTSDKWTNIVKLFGPNGACAGCWCMRWELSKAQSKIKKTISYAGKKKAKIVEGYPVDLTRNKNYSDTFAYHGTR